MVSYKVQKDAGGSDRQSNQRVQCETSLTKAWNMSNKKSSAGNAYRKAVMYMEKKYGILKK